MLKHITLVQNLTTDPDNLYADQVISFFRLHQVEVSLVTVEEKDFPEIPRSEALQRPDLVIVLGGDGTFLRTARQFIYQQVPLVGVNTGKLGFLTHIDVQRLQEYLLCLLEGRYSLEHRTMLQIDGLDRERGEWNTVALNDVVVKNANPSQLCNLRLYVNEILVAIYDADGLILSTPSGSTAYNLSAGGPVIAPEVDAISITPICPHSFSAKAVVVPLHKAFRVESGHKNEEVIFALDGAEAGMLMPGDSLTVRRSPLCCKMVHFDHKDSDFYNLLKRKLNWALNPRWQTDLDA